MGDPAVEVSGVSKRFRLYHERNQSLKAAFMRGRRARYDEFWALKDVNLEVPTGKTFGLIGLFLGPVVMAALLTVWRSEVRAASDPDARLYSSSPSP